MKRLWGNCMNSLIFYTDNQNMPLMSFGYHQGTTITLGKLLPNLSRLNNARIPAIAVSPDGRKLVAGYNNSSISNNYKYFVIKDLDNPIASQPLVSFDGYINGVACSQNHYLFFGVSPFIRMYDWNDNFFAINTDGLGEVVHAIFNTDGSKIFVAHRNPPYLRVYDIVTGSYIDKKEPTSNYVDLIFYINDKLCYVDAYFRRLFVLDDKLEVVSKSLTEHRCFSTYERYFYLVKHPKKENVVLINSGSIIYEYHLIDHTIQSVISSNYNNIYYFTIIEHNIYIYFYNNNKRQLQVYDLDYQLDQKTTETLWLLNGIGFQVVQAKFDTAKITGIVRDVNNQVASRVVRAYDRKTGEIVAQTQSNTQGEYMLELPNTNPVDVQFMAQDGELLNDLFYANVSPEPA